MRPLFLFDYVISEFLAIYLVKERNFGMVLNDRNSIVYFEYDSEEPDWMKRTGGINGKKSALYTNFLKEEIDIISWHFDYEDGSFLFIADDYEIYQCALTIQYNETDRNSPGSVTEMELSLVNGTYQSQFESNQVKGYGKYRIFTKNDTLSTGGRVVVYYDETIWHAWVGGPGNYIGEHIWIGEDSKLDL